MTIDAALLQATAGACTLTDGGHHPVLLAVSPHAIAQRQWPQGRPGPLQLEQAIDDVENAIEKAGLLHADRGLLRVDAGLSALLQPVLQGPATFGRDAVEAAFSRLVAASGPAGHAGAASGDSAAALLLVRELMHHLGFQALATGG